MTNLRVNVALALSIIVAVLVAMADRVVDLTPDEPQLATRPAETVTELTAGQWICPMADSAPETQLRLVVARPDASDADTAVQVMGLDAGATTNVSGGELEVEAHRVFDADSVAMVRWAGSPVVVHREWWFEGGDLPPGIIAGGCVSGLSDQWVVPGMSTTGGSEATLRLTNPYTTDASVRLRFLTPEGPEEPLALQNVSVEARSTVEVVVNEALPERDDLSALVEVASGRVVVEGMQLVRSAIGDIDGASVLAAAGRPGQTLSVPWVVDAEDRSSWLWIVNPTDRTAIVEVGYHTLEGGSILDGHEEVEIPEGSLVRIDLAGSFPDEQIVGVTLRSDGAPVVASVASEIVDDQQDRTGIAVQLAAEPSTSWIVSGGEATGREEQLHLVNPSSASATVDVAIRTDTRLHRPVELRQVVFGPGARAALDLSEMVANTSHWSAFVSSDRPVVAGRVGGSSVGPRRLVAVPGVSAAAWTADGPALTGRRTDGLVTRLSTLLGIVAVDDRLAPPLDRSDELEELDERRPRPVTPPTSIVPGDAPADDVPDDETDDETDDDVGEDVDPAG